MILENIVQVGLTVSQVETRKYQLLALASFALTLSAVSFLAAVSLIILDNQIILSLSYQYLILLSFHFLIIRLLCSPPLSCQLFGCGIFYYLLGKLDYTYHFNIIFNFCDIILSFASFALLLSASLLRYL